MNNALMQIDEEEVIDPLPKLRQEQTRLAKIIDSINALATVPEWSVVKELIFDGQLERIEKAITAKAKELTLDDPEIYRLQGELKWAKRYSDLYKLAETYKQDLNNITKKLNENANI